MAKTNAEGKLNTGCEPAPPFMPSRVAVDMGTVMARAPMLLAICALWVAGCGSSGASTTATELSTSQLAAQANAICNRATAEQRAIPRKNTATVLLSRIEAVSSREVAALGKLTPPASERSSYTALLSASSEINVDLTQLASTAASDAKLPPTLLKSGAELAAAARPVAEKLGLTACVEPTGS